jgi:hypothetical protein
MFGISSVAILCSYWQRTLNKYNSEKKRNSVKLNDERKYKVGSGDFFLLQDVATENEFEKK